MNKGNSTDFNSHKIDQRLENYEFLVSCGLSRESIARRLGISEQTLVKELERKVKRGKSDPDSETRSGQSA